MFFISPKIHVVGTHQKRLCHGYSSEAPQKDASDEYLQHIFLWRKEKKCQYVWFENCLIITKTYLYNFDPLKPHFYIVKLGFTRITLFFLFLLKNIDCGYSLEPPRRGGSNEYPQSMF